MNMSILIRPELSPEKNVIKSIDNFLNAFRPHEVKMGTKLILYFDEKSEAYYLMCHLDGNVLGQHCDLEASLDANEEEDEIYKLNREITEDQAAYKLMEEDARNGRSFEDLVLEYDTSYRATKPLKVYGGQHRLRAIMKAQSNKGAVLHGARVYFDLSREQKVEIATVSNTSIAVPNDLLDRMREQLLGSELRDWSQAVGLLDKGVDFADRRSPDMPTVRIVRTLLVNFYLGMKAAELDDFHQPIICKSGGIDEEYLKVRSGINWNDESLKEMGKHFARLHKLQRKSVIGRLQDNYAEFARKALSLSVVAAWGYAAGLFQRDQELLNIHYSIPESVSLPEDPLNAKALSLARLKHIDPDTYRGLGARSSPRELGRMLEVFIVLATKASKKRITKELANAAIQSYEAKRAVHEANRVLGKI
jgi:hypothetical protein